MTTQRAYNLGASAAAYSAGIRACPFDVASTFGKAWLKGYGEAYANG